SHGGTVYVVAGHGGAGVSLNDNHVLTVFGEGERGSCIIDVQDNRLTLTNVREDGEITDRMDMVKGDAIVLGQPNGGEHLVPGTVYDVGWRTVGDLESVRIELSTDGGARWSTVEASTPDTGEYQWLVPETLSDQVLLRVSDAMAGGVLTDESNGVFSVGPPSVQGVIAFGDTWRYHDQGEDLGLSWLTADYDDTAWMEGPAHLGYGDGDEATTVRNAPPGGPTVYVRKVVQLTEKPVRAELSVLFDDGVIVWVNGQEVFSDNTYSTSHDSYATTRWVHDNEVRTTDIDPFPFVVGDNVVAAVIKSSSPSSDDLSFDLALSVLAEQGPPPPATTPARTAPLATPKGPATAPTAAPGSRPPRPASRPWTPRPTPMPSPISAAVAPVDNAAVSDGPR
ncbi:MAG: hypothetical protein JKY37_21485, partial [Nannocystaceae bacterium]|nr:hypothetical protein [Nannocystaceae bacterium]